MSEFIFHKEEEKDVREENIGENGGAKFAENRNDEIVRQGIEQVTLSSDIRGIPARSFGGEISPSLHISHVLAFNNSRVTKPSPRSHISLTLSLSLYLNENLIFLGSGSSPV